MDKIDRFVEKYWQAYSYDYNKPLEPQIEKHIEKMIKKYGEETIEQYFFILKNYEKISEEDKLEFAFSTGIYKDIDPEYILARKEMLKMTLKYIDDTVKSIADIGCGDGKFTIGIAKYFPHIQHFYMIDNSPEGTKRLKNNVKQEKDIRDKFVILQKDYYSKEFKEYFENEKIDLAIMICPDTIEGIHNIYQNIETKTIIALRREYDTEKRFEINKRETIENLQRVARIRFETIEYKKVMPEEAIMMIELER